MQEIITRAGCFIGIILLGYMMRRVGVFKESDFSVLSKIVIRITLPAAIVFSFKGKEITPEMMFLPLLGLGCGIIYMCLGFLLGKKNGKEEQAFMIINSSGYNIGNFTLPFVQSFLGPVGVITTSLFDTGNACVVLGGSYSIASTVKGSGKFSLLIIGKKLLKSVPFICYLIMFTVSLAKIPVPDPVYEFAGTIANANAFTAMLMIGVGFKLSGDRSQIRMIVKILVTRYSVAVLAALGFYFLLPISLEIRQALVLLAFAPIASAAPAYTEELKGDVGLASAVNSISILISIVLMVGILVVML